MDEKTARLKAYLLPLIPIGVELVTIQQSMSKKSYYCLFYKEQIVGWKVIRISDHKPYHRRFDIPTFISKTNSNLLSEITSYLEDGSAWFKIKFTEFVALEFIKQRHQHNSSFHLAVQSNTNQIDYFYALYHKNHNYERIFLDAYFQKVLKKFYGRGIINCDLTHHSPEIFITEIGINLYRNCKKYYQSSWEKYEKQFNYATFQLPVAEEYQYESKNRQDKSFISKANFKIRQQLWQQQLKIAAIEIRQLLYATLALMFIYPIEKLSLYKKKQINNKQLFSNEKIALIKQQKQADKHRKAKIKGDIFIHQIEQRSTQHVDKILSDEMRNQLEQMRETLD